MVIHDTEGPVGPNAAKNVAAYFARGTEDNQIPSTHLVVDEDSCYRCLPNAVVPWGAASSSAIRANTRGVHVELCAYARWSRAEWLQHEKTLDRAAFKAALHLVAYKLPARWVGQAGLIAGRPGLTTHNDVSQASKKTDPFHASRYSHYDPGPNFPKDHFLALVNKHLAEL